MRKFFYFFTLLPLSFSACNPDFSKVIDSPSGKVSLQFELADGVPLYSVKKQGINVILPSKLGFEFNNIPALDGNFKVASVNTSSFDQTWEQPWGEQRQIRNNYTQLDVMLVEKNNLQRKLNIIFKVYDDGVGFRYIIPEQHNIGSIEIADEKTEFALAGNDSAWWIGAYQPERYEYLYKKTAISEMDTAHTPLTIECLNGLFVSVHEANLTDYASMTVYRKEGNTLKCDLVPWADGTKVYGKAPLTTPWRTIQIAETPGGLNTSYLVLNLNDPCALNDISWIKPAKYIGIWWGMHIDKYTWAQGPKHGATTKNMKYYIDFAAENGFDAVLAEGWNYGWDTQWWADTSLFDYTTPYPDFDIAEITRYAASKKIAIIGHHETGSKVKNYENQMDSAYKFYRHHNIGSVKLGYVGHKMDRKEWHHGQFGVRHYRKATELAAKNHLAINIHEPIKQTGLRRTFPNLMAAEGARGQEYNAWSTDGGNPPEHETILPFTRILAGPMDFTPGIFNISIPEKPYNQVNTTLAKQLALYVVLYSPLQMAADIPENYTGNPAFSFIKDVPVDWEETRVLYGKIGDYITTVRKDKYSDNWYLGSITDENSREFDIVLSFLEPGRKYTATIYADGQNAHYQGNPLSISINKQIVGSENVLPVKLAAGGGIAISFKPVN
ncbi:MAG: glycoside hydrolase family 97 protein [Bacteroidales bacterium]|nr:glycoside hydrolase family 97 protein [Bacteroidales bacterium]